MHAVCFCPCLSANSSPFTTCPATKWQNQHGMHKGEQAIPDVCTSLSCGALANISTPWGLSVLQDSGIDKKQVSTTIYNLDRVPHKNVVSALGNSN